jgi:hypothetical protein
VELIFPIHKVIKREKKKTINNLLLLGYVCDLYAHKKYGKEEI